MGIVVIFSFTRPPDLLLDINRLTETQRETDLHVPEELEYLHGPEDNVLDRLLANATQ